MSITDERYISPQEYLTVERASEIRHEYFQGEMFARMGANRAHNLIAGNIACRVHKQFDGRDCDVYVADMRVKVEANGFYAYPDVILTGDTPEFEDEQTDTLLNPRVIGEVLSKSTEDYDRGSKFERYRRLPSLHDYVLVSQDKMHVEHFQRQPDGRWILEEFDAPERTLAFETSNCTLNVADIYTKVCVDNVL